MAWTYQDWYEKNKDKLSKSRKRKYRIDKGFREDMKNRSRKYYSNNLKIDHPRVVMVVGGKKFLTIGGLSKAISRDVHTIRVYHKDGVIPETDRGNTRGWRVYSFARAKVIREAFIKFDNGDLSSLKDVSKFIKDRW